MNHEPELVEEVASKQRTDESAASEDRDVLSRLQAHSSGDSITPSSDTNSTATTFLMDLLRLSYPVVWP